MKTIITLFAMSLGFGAMAQNDKIELKEVADLCCCFGRLQLVRVVPVLPEPRLTDYLVASNRIIQPTTINELPNGTMLLSEDLPYVHTIRGAVYTADYLRYTVRN